jgi:Ankyrin repeat
MALTLYEKAEIEHWYRSSVDVLVTGIALVLMIAMLYDVFRLIRDDEHCTALMLAAAAGHTAVMKILLDNHASVNDVDKMKVCVCSCFNGRVK